MIKNRQRQDNQKYLRLPWILTYLKKFLEIKDHLGVHADAEVVRALINYYYRNEVEVAKRKAQVG